MTETPTSYSLLIMFKDVIYAVRDPYGNRPLCIGQLVPVSKLHSSGTGLQPGFGGQSCIMSVFQEAHGTYSSVKEEDACRTSAFAPLLMFLLTC